MTRGTPGSVQPHGTPARGRTCHCQRCRAAVARRQADYRKDRILGRPRTITQTGTCRRLQGLAAIGWPFQEMAQRTGVTRAAIQTLQAGRRTGLVSVATAQRVRDLYEALSMTPGPSPITRRRAAAAGWAPPLAWDDTTIDDPQARPVIDDDGAGLVDYVAVELACAGQRRTDLTRPERHVAVARLADLRLSDTAIAQRLGVSPMTVLRDRQHLGIAAVATNQWSAAS